MIHTYCTRNLDCHKSTLIISIVKRYEEILGEDCYTLGLEEEDNTVTALKGLRNIGFITNSARNVVTKCFKTDVNPTEVRLAALGLMQHLTCTNKSFYKIFLETLSDHLVDSELRIGAYLALMSCPSRETVDSVKEILADEPTNQGNLKFNFIL